MSLGTNAEDVDIFPQNQHIKNVLFPDLFIHHRFGHEALIDKNLLDLGHVNRIQPFVLVLELDFLQELFLLGT
jgi:hypothetical protein